MNNVEVIRKTVTDFEEALLELPQIDLPLQHHFAEGIYGREMFVPAGSAFTGKVHKTEHMSILLSGEMLIKSTEAGSDRIIAPCMFVSPPNTKKAGFAVTDCIFMTIHGTHERDLDKIELELISDSFLGDE